MEHTILQEAEKELYKQKEEFRKKCIINTLIEIEKCDDRLQKLGRQLSDEQVLPVIACRNEGSYGLDFDFKYNK